MDRFKNNNMAQPWHARGYRQSEHEDVRSTGNTMNIRALQIQDLEALRRRYLQYPRSRKRWPLLTTPQQSTANHPFHHGDRERQQGYLSLLARIKQNTVQYLRYDSHYLQSVRPGEASRNQTRSYLKAEETFVNCLCCQRLPLLLRAEDHQDKNNSPQWQSLRPLLFYTPTSKGVSEPLRRPLPGTTRRAHRL